MPIFSSLSDFFSNFNVQLYLLAYLLGAVPFGLVLAKVFAGVNIKESGSGSIGATNVLRVVKAKNPKLGKILSIVTFICDFLKGGLVIFLAKILGVENLSIFWTIAVLAVVGHCFSLYLGFEGGKGVATGLGVIAFLFPAEAIFGATVWFVVGKKFKISSLASLAGVLGAVTLSFFVHPDAIHTPLLLIAFIILYKHLPNIYRLFSGKEKAVI